MIKIIKNSPMLLYTIDALLRGYICVLYIKSLSNSFGEIVTLVFFPVFWIYILNPIMEKLEKYIIKQIQ